MAAWYTNSWVETNSLPANPVIFEPAVVPSTTVTSVDHGIPDSSIRSNSRASSRSRSRSPAAPPSPSVPVLPNPALAHSPRLSVDHARRLSGSASPRASSPRVHSPLASPVTPQIPPGSPLDEDYLQPGYQPTLMYARSSSRHGTPEIFIPPLEPEPASDTRREIPLSDPNVAAPGPSQWGHPYNQVAYPQFSYYPPQPYSHYGMPSPYWPSPFFNAPYIPPMSTPYGGPVPFAASTVHNTPFPQTPYLMDAAPPTPWMPTTPWATTGFPGGVNPLAPIRLNPRLSPGSLRWDLLHPPDQVRYISPYGALKAPKFSDEALDVAPLVKVAGLAIAGSSHPVLNYWIPIWGPILLPPSKRKMFDVLSAVYEYLSQPLTNQEMSLLLATPQNISHARIAKEVRAKDSWALECVVLGEEGYRRIDVIGAHRGFGGIEVGSFRSVDVAGLPEEAEGEQESQVEVDLIIGLSQLPGEADENGY